MIEPRLVLPGVEVYIGDARETVLKLAEKYRNKVSSVITSPAYKGLRRYLPPGHPDADKEMGQEPTIEEYVGALCDVFDLIGKPLLRPDGSIWCNLGDSYAGSGGAGGDYAEGGLREGQPKWKPPKTNIPRKSLMGVPERFFLAMIDRGWVCRNKPVWFKGRDLDDEPEGDELETPASNGMPISARDRLKGTWEQWYHFTKSNRPLRWINLKTCQMVSKRPKQEYEVGEDGKRRPLWIGEDYFYDLDNARVPMVRGTAGSTFTDGKTGATGLGRVSQAERIDNPLGRNPGDLWFCPTQPFPLAHYACFPPGITEIPVKTTTPEAVCRKCGAPRRAIYSIKSKPADGRDTRLALVPGNREQQSGNYWTPPDVTFVGHTDCGCNAGWEGAFDLDPFGGSGSTAQGVFENRPPVVVDGYLCQPTTILIDLDERNLPIIEMRLTGRARPSRRADTKRYHGGGFLAMLETEGE